MTVDTQQPDVLREEAHPKAREALTDAFFWDTEDAGSPLGGDTGRDVLEALHAAREEDPRGSTIAVLDEILARWEVANDSWDVVSEREVQIIGEDDEFSLLTRDEAILALAFAQLVVEGRVDAEVRRRALLALTRQTLPALLHGWGDKRLERALRVERMREILARRWE
ncbi:MAG: hypothetical protein ABI134_14930 [Byssovorax sp.]